jgi:UDP-3-O-[3-hydroxymyristoyl] N-acetylglucosamine deacetylase
MMTIKNTISVTGPHPFKPDTAVDMTVSPGNDGINFHLNGTVIKCRPENALTMNGKHTTGLGTPEKYVMGVEHLLSALWGEGIYHAEICLSDNAVPFVDLSSEYLTKLIRGADKLESKRIKPLYIWKTMCFEQNGSLAIIHPSVKVIVDATIQFENPIGEQRFIMSKYSQVFNARTFIKGNCTKEYWENARKSVCVLPEKREDSPIPVFCDKKWIVPPRGIEPVKHKILDFLGDIMVLGRPVIGEFVLFRPGHEFNRFLVVELAKLC